MLDFSHNLSNPNTSAAHEQRTRRYMYHDLVCERQKLSNAHSKLRLELRQKGKLSRHTHICRMPSLFLLWNISLADT
jgi:hypothetical protein